MIDPAPRWAGRLSPVTELRQPHTLDLAPVYDNEVVNGLAFLKVTGNLARLCVVDCAVIVMVKLPAKSVNVMKPHNTMTNTDRNQFV